MTGQCWGGYDLVRLDKLGLACGLDECEKVRYRHEGEGALAGEGQALVDEAKIPCEGSDQGAVMFAGKRLDAEMWQAVGGVEQRRDESMPM